MMCLIKYRFSVAVLCVLTTLSTYGQTDAPSRTEKSPDTRFRYVIVKGVSEIEEFVNSDPDDLSIEVLMEDRAFSEKNLKILFRLLGDRYKSKKALSIDVFTSLDAILTPEENDRQPLKGPISDYRKYKFAFYVRNGFGERFSYGIPGKQREKCVVIASASDGKSGC